MRNILLYLNYLDLFFYLILVFVVTAIIIILIKIISFYKIDSEKLSIYECGFEATTNIRQYFSINYITLAILYLIFDLEILILLPFVLFYHLLHCYIALFFIFFLLIGFFFEWIRGTLEWL